MAISKSPSPAPALNRKAKLEAKELSERVDRVTQADAAFFKRHPDRTHRVRLAAHVEIQQDELLGCGKWMVPEGDRVFVAVRNVKPGARLRVMTVASEGAETDLSEKLARWIFERAAPPQFRETEADLREAFRVRT